MGTTRFILKGERYDKRELLERMCRYGVARWGLDEALQIAQLEAEIAELKALDEHLKRAVKARCKRIAELKRQSPTLQQKRWDEARVERTVFLLTSDTSLEGAAYLLGVTRDTLASTLSTSLKLLKRREAEAANRGEAIYGSLALDETELEGAALDEACLSAEALADTDLAREDLAGTDLEDELFFDI